MHIECIEELYIHSGLTEAKWKIFFFKVNKALFKSKHRIVHTYCTIDIRIIFFFTVVKKVFGHHTHS